ncbi:hypothetical protein N6B72_08885 [Chryseobacterium soli]|uniref:hypothetical protein n=1 Tax=Chryseobacterium soli TaxID=445961 RepID=UPI002954EE41|nr:hypothetical protein [Chryseobacterium soli]MDV7697035.1 hypothetical protein [Chryseobacterium soli]
MFQINFQLLLKKIFCSILLGIFLFAHCKTGNDSINKGNIENDAKAKFFIIKGTVISGIKNIKSAEVNIIEKKDSRISKIISKKLSQKLPQNKEVEKEKYSIEYAVNTISICSKDADEKYHSLLSGELKVIHGNPYKYDGIPVGQQNFFIFFPYEAGVINTSKDLITSLGIIKYCCIRPPPIS